VIGLVDDDLVEFLEEVDYNNTALFIVSDHGLHMNIMFAFREQSVIKVCKGRKTFAGYEKKKNII
jgi:predicted AlkP superfamily phosphohydrolase/phosphomutase